MSVTRLVFAGLIFAALSACGGGDSSDADPSHDVTVHLDSPANLRAEVLEGLPLPDIELVGSVSGDVSSLSNKTIYVTIVDPDHLFEQSSLITSYPTNNRVTIDVRGAAQTSPRHAVGSVAINACLDAECNKPLAGSPLHLPYDIDVLPGMTVDTTPISAIYRFGDDPVVRTLHVTLPKYLAGWGVEALESDGSPSTHVIATNETGAAGQMAAVTLTFVPSQSGSYTGLLKVSTGVESPDNLSRVYQREITLNYDVIDNPAVTAFYYPSSLDLSISRASSNALYTSFEVVGRTDHVESAAFVEYLSAPSAAIGHPNVGSWMTLFSQPAVGACFHNNGINNPPDCLPEGIYTARVRTTSTVDAVGVDLGLPVTMTVTP